MGKHNMSRRANAGSSGTNYIRLQMQEPDQVLGTLKTQPMHFYTNFLLGKSHDYVRKSPGPRLRIRAVLVSILQQSELPIDKHVGGLNSSSDLMTILVGHSALW